jgi:hypothetical protein
MTAAVKPQGNKSMKTNRNILKVAAALVAGICLAGTAKATPITGNIGFTGTVQLDTTSVNTATEATAWFNTIAASPSGSFLGLVAQGDAVSMAGATPWTFNSGALANFWKVDGFTFNLISSSIFSQTGGFLDVVLSGIVSGNGFTATDFNGSFQVGNPSSNGDAQFTERLSFASVPDGGTTALLLGCGLLGLTLIHRRMPA